MLRVASVAAFASAVAQYESLSVVGLKLTLTMDEHSLSLPAYSVEPVSQTSSQVMPVIVKGEIINGPGALSVEPLASTVIGVRVDLPIATSGNAPHTAASGSAAAAPVDTSNLNDPRPRHPTEHLKFPILRAWLKLLGLIALCLALMAIIPIWGLLTPRSGAGPQ